MILFRYILKNHFLPFVFATFTLISVFLLQFLMKFADRLVGKGLSFWVITQLIAYNLAWMVVLVVPMAVLIATLMAFGNLAQNNEIAILKATGVSLYKMIIPPILAASILAYLLIQFNNYVYPEANHEARILMQDITRKKPTLSLVPGVFSHEVQNYSILVRNIDQKTNMLDTVTIYDFSEPSSLNIITAERGKIYFSKDQKKLVMDLWNGEIHESKINDVKPYRKLIFEKHKITMNADQFSFQQSTPGGPKSDRELGAQDMIVIVDSLGKIGTIYRKELSEKIDENLKVDSSYIPMASRGNKNLSHIYLKVENYIRNSQSIMRAALQRVETNQKDVNRYWVEIHKKYSIPAACIVFILIGAPLGTMTRKGGFGMAAGISLIFFLIYWAFLIGGEKLADRGLMSPFWGMWSANFLLAGLGVWLLVKSARERVTISFDWIQKLVPKQMRSQKGSDENTRPLPRKAIFTDNFIFDTRFHFTVCNN